MKIRFTEHAVDRFVERAMPSASKEEAVREMDILARTGRLLKERTLTGDTQLLADGGIVFVLKHDGAGGCADCTTVLFDSRAVTNPLAEEIAQFGQVPNLPAPAPLRRRRKSKRSRHW